MSINNFSDNILFTALLGTTDFVWSDGTVVFRTCPRESDRLVFQIVSRLLDVIAVELVFSQVLCLWNHLISLMLQFFLRS